MPASYVLRRGKVVRLPAETEAAFDAECAGCGKEHPAPVVVSPSFRGMGSKVWRRIPVPLCLRCAWAQDNPHWVHSKILAYSTVAVTALSFSIVSQIAPTAALWLSLGFGAVLVALHVLRARHQAPVLIAVVARGDEMAYRFRSEERAIAFARANSDGTLPSSP